MIARRALLAASLALAAAPARALAAAEPSASAPRVAALDWALAAACLSIGLPPAGVAEQRLYRRWVREPALPAATEELGLRTAPSLEGLAALKPDLILANDLDAPLLPQLTRIAPVLSLSIYGEERRPLALARDAVLDLGRRFGRSSAAERFAADTDAALAACLDALASAPRRAILPFAFEDARHIQIYGRGSLFADTLARIGLDAAWTGPTSPWGTALADVGAVADHPGATLVAIEPIPAEARATLDGRGLWEALTADRAGGLVVLPPVWAYGEFSAARRFAEQLTAALPDGQPHAG